VDAVPSVFQVEAQKTQVIYQFFTTRLINGQKISFRTCTVLLPFWRGMAHPILFTLSGVPLFIFRSTITAATLLTIVQTYISSWSNIPGGLMKFGLLGWCVLSMHLMTWYRWCWWWMRTRRRACWDWLLRLSRTLKPGQVFINTSHTLNYKTFIWHLELSTKVSFQYSQQ